MEAKLFSVEELAKATGTSARAVRLYMKKGLLTPQRAGRVYVFTQRDLKTLEHIQRSQRLGLSLKEIKDVTTQPSLHSLEAWQKKLKNLVADAAHELEDVRKKLQDIKNKGANS
jgi:DNA-binding transcriptional MerR regulator